MGRTPMHVSHALDAQRWELRKGVFYRQPARIVYEQLRDASAEDRSKAWVSGRTVSERYGWLAHYTTRARWDDMRMATRVGLPSLHLTPTGYDPETGAIELGLPQLCDRCLLIDVSGCEKLWGPGQAAPSLKNEDWPGGGLEFYLSEGLPTKWVMQVFGERDGRMICG